MKHPKIYWICLKKKNQFITLHTLVLVIEKNFMHNLSAFLSVLWWQKIKMI